MIESLHEEFNRAAKGHQPLKTVETTDPKALKVKYEEWMRDYFKKTNDSPISLMFYGHTVECMTCMTCGKSKYQFGFFNALPLEISENIQKNRKPGVT